VVDGEPGSIVPSDDLSALTGAIREALAGDPVRLREWGTGSEGAGDWTSSASSAMRLRSMRVWGVEA
jgi:hypothetical protein